MAMLERLERLVLTDDDWAPNFNSKGKGDRAGHFVKVQFIELLEGRGWMVRVTGADDDAMERDFPVTDHELASLLYGHLAELDSISKKYLKFFNFVRG